MKIKSKIALRYTAVTAILLACFSVFVYVFSTKNRQDVFYKDLKKEGISKASLFFNSAATSEILQAIYKSNSSYINEVEIAIYSMDGDLIYHDDLSQDIVKETPELLISIRDSSKDLEFHEGVYEAIGFKYLHDGQEYIITAAAYDGYGYESLHNLIKILIVSFVVSTLGLFIIGYCLAQRALRPVAKITREFENVMSSNMFPIIRTQNEKDEIGLLAIQINRALGIIKDAYDSQKMFISNVSHEIRTPLATIVGEIDIALLKDREPEEYIKVLEQTKLDAHEIIKLISGLLDLAKANYDSSKVAMSVVDVDELLLDACETILKQNKNNKVNLNIDSGEGSNMSFRMLGNPYLLHVAFVNLIENNCKFSKTRESTVQLTLDDNQIKLSFSDNGIGIDADELENIFTPFYRGKNKDYSAGYGIGLALVKRVVRLHHGEIGVKSEQGIGTFFTLLFPALD